jgi:hypothetical protein
MQMNSLFFLSILCWIVAVEGQLLAKGKSDDIYIVRPQIGPKPNGFVRHFV